MPMQVIVTFAAIYVGIPTACFLVFSLFEGFPRLKLRQVAGIVAATALVFSIFSVGPQGETPIIAILVVAPLMIFFGLWRQEFRHLMLRTGDEFPDPGDKSRWFGLLTLGAPAGVWLFRSFRKARWPEPAAGPRGRQSPWDEEMDEARSREPAAVE
jgi:hypothetical protein